MTLEPTQITANSLSVQKLEQKFEEAWNTPSDISEHLYTLRDIASTCSSILELGTRSGVSTIAFLAGLAENDSVLKNLVCCDLVYDDRLTEIASLAAEANVVFEFVTGDDLELDIGKHTLFSGPADIVFIDTWHVYAQLKRELAKFESLARKYIILHDTEVDAEFGESVRCGWDVPEQAKKTGFSEEEIRRGLRPAVEEFLNVHDNWKLKAHYKNCNGLTILERT